MKIHVIKTYFIYYFGHCNKIIIVIELLFYDGIILFGMKKGRNMVPDNLVTISAEGDRSFGGKKAVSGML